LKCTPVKGGRSSVAKYRYGHQLLQTFIEPLEARRLLASITAVSPSNLSIGVAPDAHLSVTFGSAMNTATINSSTYELFQAGAPVPTRLSYNPDNNTATLDATAPLSYGTLYTLQVTGGAGGVQDSGGGTLASTFTETFTTAQSPTSGPGGPILVVTNSTDQFSSYYPEILKAEGLNEYATADISGLSSSLLTSYQVLVLGEVALTASQVSTITTWVQAGGKLIAMRPDAQLSSLLGIASTGQTMAEAYLQINNSTTVGSGLVNTTIQYHGTADLYTLNGATSLANLYSDASTPTNDPAVTSINVGSNGGQAVAFTFDLAKSIVETRQGNPAFAGEERDGQTQVRSDDQFFGPSATDTETSWVDLNKVAVPQADEEQRLFSNIIEQMQLSAAPLPRFWYFPNDDKSLIIMTGDDHDTGGTIPRWQGYVADGSIDGTPITGSSYIFPGVNNTDALLAQYEAEGFEPALHLDIDPGLIFGNSSDLPINFTSQSELENIFQTQIADFEAAYPSIPSPTTERTHGVIFSDYATEPEVEFQNGIRMDLNYYYWPQTFANDHPGMFTGSGLPMLFATASGQTIDVFQESTVMTDEGGQTAAYNINALLAAATGPQQFYGAWAIQAHTDTGNTTAETESAAVIAAAQQYDVPVISAADLLNFEDGRDGSSFSNTTWNASTGVETFTITEASMAGGLTTMVPLVDATGRNVSSITINGTAVSFTKQNMAGIEYAYFAAAPGTVQVTYSNNATPLTITPVSPVTGATNVAINSTISVTFNEAIDPSTLSYALFDSNGNVIPTTTTYNAGTLTATLTPMEVLRSGFTYSVSASALDASDHASATPQTTWSFTTAAPVVTAGATYSLWNESVTPTVSTDNTAVEVGMQFSSDVSGYVTGIMFYKGAQNTGTHIGNLWTSDGTLLATGTFSNETASGWQTLTFARPVPIVAGEVYVASYHTNTGFYAATNGYFNTSGMDSGPLHAPASSVVLGGNGVFNIGATSAFPQSTFQGSNYWVDVDFTPGTVTIPTVTARTPVSTSTGVSVNTTLSATFSEAITLSTLSFVLNDLNGNPVAGTVTYNSSTNTATFTPTAPLNPYTQYVATVSGAQDALGNAMITPVNWSFTTAPAIPGTVNLFGTQIPGNTGVADPTPVEVGVKFESTVSGQVLGIRFYKNASNTGVHTGTLWSSTGQVLATGTFTNESASGWETLTFSSPVTIAANTIYVASYHTTTGYYADDYYYFTDGGAASGPLIAPQSGVDGGNGVFALGNGGIFPTQDYLDSNYWVDVNFIPGGTTSPVVSSVSPSAGATGVLTTTAISVTFNEALNPSTLTSGTVQLLDSGSNPVAAVLAYTPGSTTLTLTPSAALAAGETYTINLTGGIQDTLGNGLTPFTSSFTTAPNTTQTDYSLWNNSTVPSIVNVQDDQAIEVGVQFESSETGYITGVRFYKGSENTGTHIGNLWTSTGTLLATATFSNETAGGWQQVNFSTPVLIQANTIYVASYHTNVGFYSADSEYFASSGFTNGPLTALSNSAAPGGNGLFSYGAASQFPTSSYQATNLWVDVVFTPLVPAVTAQTPAPGAANVPVAAAVTATFNEAVTAGSILFTLKDSGGNPVATTFAYNSSTNTATWTPTAILKTGMTYTATVSGATDANSNVMASPATWSFTTVAPNIPVVTAETPASGATNVAASSAVTATFNQAVTPASILFTLQDSGGNSIATTFAYNSSTNTATWTPVSPLNNATTYTATVSGATNANGDVMAAPFSWSFTTAVIPAVTAETPLSGATNVPVAAAVTAMFNEAVTAASILFTLQDSGGNSIATIFAYNSSTNTATWTPTAILKTGMTYTATVSGATDSNSNVMAAPFSWSFSTVAPVIPVVTSETPISGATNVAVASSLSATFNEAVTPGSILFTLKDSGGNSIATTFGYNPVTSTATWTPVSPLNTATTYTATVSGATNSNGDVMAAPFSWSFTTVVIPLVTSETPAPGATSVPVASAVSAAFNEAVTPGSIVLTLKDSGGNPVATAFAYNSSTNTATWTPTAILKTGMTYTATVSGATDSNSNVMATPATWSFTTVAPNIPVVISETPVSGATNVAVNSSVSATFNEAVTAGSILFTLKDSGGNSIATNFAYNASTNTATWTPVSPLNNATTYTATVSGAANSNGDVMAAPFNWSFTTVVIPTVTSVSPLGGQLNVPVASAISATFNEAVTPGSIGFTLTDSGGNPVATTFGYNASTNTATWTPTTILKTGMIYTASVSGATDSNGNPMPSPFSWSFVTVASNIPVVTSETPVPGATNVAINSSVSATFNGAVTPGSILFTLQDSGGNSVATTFAYNAITNTATWTPVSPLNTATTYTATISGATNSNGDVMASPFSWSFTTLVIPALTSETPAPSAASVPVASAIAATFNEGVTPASILFTLQDSGGNSIATTFAYNATTNTATWTPTAILKTGMTYAATVSGATDSNSNVMAAPFGWSFTTVAPNIPVVTAQTPAPGATGVGINPAVSATFNEGVTPGSILFTLTDSSQNPVATTFAYNPSTNTATWTPTAALQTGMTYTATVSGATNANGDVMASPTSWSFTTAVAPVVSSFSVNGGAVQRSMDTLVTVVFSQPVNLNNAIALVQRATGGGSPTPMAFTLASADNMTWNLTFPSGKGASLPNGIYDLTVTAANVTSITSGLAMPADQVFTFHRLFGDADGNGIVNNADYFAFKKAYAQTIGSPGYNPIFDYDGNGVVNNADYFQFKLDYGVQLLY
jgi:methionine-rich copper-binding protein CopC